MKTNLLLNLKFIYAAPALLCCMAMLSGFIPAVFCLDGRFFAYVSLIVFGVSIGLHIVILFMWQKFQNSAPFAYALVQPCLHFILLILALTVGSTNLCAPGRADMSEENALKEFDLQFRERVSPKP